MGNQLRNNSRDGLHIEGTSKNLLIFGNQWKQNGSFDAFDSTANLWFGNQIGTRNRPGLNKRFQVSDLLAPERKLWTTMEDE